MSNSTKIAFDKARLELLLSSLSSDDILVGGQALLFWLDYYNIGHPNNESITKDADILGTNESVKRISTAMRGVVEYPPAKGFGTVIVGQVWINIGKKQIIGVDVINEVKGLDSNKIRKRALKVTIESSTFKILHPIDCFESKVTNLAKIDQKQDRNGVLQALLAIEVARSYVGGLIEAKEYKQAVRTVEHTAMIAKSAVGKKVRQMEVECYSAIPVGKLKDIEIPNFTNKRLPRLLDEIRLVE